MFNKPKNKSDKTVDGTMKSTQKKSPNYLLFFIFQVFLIVLFLNPVQAGKLANLSERSKVKNIIFYIGDGMGINQVTASRIKSVGANGHLWLDKFQVTGLVKVHSLDNLITDSAASATAMSTGYKTKNRMIACLPDSTMVKTVLEAAKDQDLSTGLIATSSITHATPACFATHVLQRNYHEEIARQLIFSGTDVLLGGGRQFFLPQDDTVSARTNGLNLVQKAESNGYVYVENKEQLMNVDNPKVLGLFQEDELKFEAGEPSLADMTRKAVEILSKNKNGFFLMVEGSQIDWAGHENDFNKLLQRMLSFDKAVGVGVQFAKEHRNTLVVVTADHETGGLNIVGGPVDGDDLEISWQCGHHTGQMVPLFAEGPGAFEFTGVLDNTDIPKIFAKLLGLRNFPEIKSN